MLIFTIQRLFNTKLFFIKRRHMPFDSLAIDSNLRYKMRIITNLAKLLHSISLFLKDYIFGMHCAPISGVSKVR